MECIAVRCVRRIRQNCCRRPAVKNCRSGHCGENVIRQSPVRLHATQYVSLETVRSPQPSGRNWCDHLTRCGTICRQPHAAHVTVASRIERAIICLNFFLIKISTLWCTIFLEKNKNISAFSITSRQWDGTGDWNLSSKETRNDLSMSLLLMTWYHKEPVHPQPWYWPRSPTIDPRGLTLNHATRDFSRSRPALWIQWNPCKG